MNAFATVLLLLLSFLRITNSDTIISAESSGNCRKIIWLTGVGSLDNSRNTEYLSYLKGALNSALSNAPSLIPFVLFAGNSANIPSWLTKMNGVNIINHNLTFFDMLKRKGVHPKFAIQHGSYLRLDIPAAMPKILPLIDKNTTEFEYVFYTDVDVLFLKDISTCMLKKPAIISLGPEIEMNSSVNSGVIYMNVEALKRELPSLLNFANARKWQFRTYDQQLILDYKWSKEIESLPNELNWKGYWGPSIHARIFHFHGTSE